MSNHKQEVLSCPFCNLCEMFGVLWNVDVFSEMLCFVKCRNFFLKCRYFCLKCHCVLTLRSPYPGKTIAQTVTNEEGVKKLYILFEPNTQHKRTQIEGKINPRRGKADEIN